MHTITSTVAPTAVGCATATYATSLYFRCARLSATITASQCRVNRERSERLQAAFDGRPMPPEFREFTCLDCPQARLVDVGSVHWFTVQEVVAGAARREPSAQRLPGEGRIGAQEGDEYFFTSHHWVPECDL